MQRQIAKLALDISKLLKELLKQENDTTSLKTKSEKDLNEQTFTPRTKKIGEK